ncbi:hypothetical protein C8J57DRAFT_1492294 [Mycena rebaudengoi]|nr:hypothetical protein C8J57DRAFT_1492294 [Mycena rebaudengoi]
MSQPATFEFVETIKPAVIPRSIATDIPLNKLRVSASQQESLEELYRASSSTTQTPADHLFQLDDDAQVSASGIMAQHGLDLDSRKILANRWSQQWSSHSGKTDPTRKILYLWYLAADFALTFSYKSSSSTYFHPFSKSVLPGGHSLLEHRAAGKRTPAVPSVAYLIPDPERDQRSRLLVDNRQISAPTLLPDTSGVFFTCYSSEALEIDTSPVIYTITVLFNGVIKCTCLDFQKYGGACKHIHAAILLLNFYRQQGMRIPNIPIPVSVADAHVLEVQTAPDVQPPALPTDLPTVRAAAVVADLLEGDEDCHDADDGQDSSQHGTSTDSDDESIASDDSSDSEDEDCVLAILPTQNQSALGEQALSGTLYELEDSAPKYGDLVEFLKNHQTPASDTTSDRLAQAWLPFEALGAEIKRIRGTSSTVFAAPLLPSQQFLPSTTKSSASTTSGASPYKRRCHLLPPSPEKPGKRHESFAPH